MWREKNDRKGEKKRERKIVFPHNINIKFKCHGRQIIVFFSRKFNARKFFLCVLFRGTSRKFIWYQKVENCSNWLMLYQTCLHFSFRIILNTISHSTWQFCRLSWEKLIFLLFECANFHNSESTLIWGRKMI